MKSILQRIGATSIRSTGGKILAIVGLLISAQVFAAAPKSGVEKQYADYLVDAIQMWSQKSGNVKLAKSAKPAHGKFYNKPPKSGGMSLASADDDSSSDDKSDDHSSGDSKSDDSSSKDDQSSDDKSDDQSSDDHSSDDQSSADKPASCLPDLKVTFMMDLLSVSITSDKKLKRVTLLFHDGSTQEAKKLKGKKGVFAGFGDKAGEMVTGVWVTSGCNESDVDESMPCPVLEDDDRSSDDDSSSDDGSSSDGSSKDRKRLKKALKSGDCDDGDVACLEAWMSDDDSSSEDKSSDDDSSSDDKNSDDDSSSEDKSSDDDDSSEDDARTCGEFFANDMTPVELASVSIADAENFEGSNLVSRETGKFSPEELEFVVTLSNPVPDGEVMEVEFQVLDGTAMACGSFSQQVFACLDQVDADFLAASGVLIFKAGSMSQSILIKTIPDDAPEDNEDFTVILLNPSENLRLGDDRATGLIKNDDDLDE